MASQTECLLKIKIINTNIEKINLGPGPSYIQENINEKLISSNFGEGKRGFSVLHQSHRSKEFETTLEEFKDKLRCF